MWQLIYDNSPWPEKPKLSRNLVSAVHSFLAVALLTTRKEMKYEIIVLNSISYFIWDLIYMMKYRKEPFYIYHHILVICVLLSNFDQHLIRVGFYYGELSNFPMYIVYHCLHSNLECYPLKVIQAIWYPYFRVFKFSKLLLKYFEYNLIYYNLVILYVCGFLFSIFQIKKLITY
jgi:hypothetical protein